MGVIGRMQIFEGIRRVEADEQRHLLGGTLGTDLDLVLFCDLNQIIRIGHLSDLVPIEQVCHEVRGHGFIRRRNH